MAAKDTGRAFCQACRGAFVEVLLLLFCLVCAACASTWDVVQLATPNPLQAQKSFGVEPVHFEGVRIGEKSEQAFLAGKDEAQKEAFEEDKKTFAQSFADQLTEDFPEVKLVPAPGPSPFIVRPRVTFIEPGRYEGVTAQPTEVLLTLEVVSIDGELFDVVKMRATVAATTTNSSSAGRLKSAAEILGGQVADFLRSRVFPE